MKGTNVESDMDGRTGAQAPSPGEARGHPSAGPWFRPCEHRTDWTLARLTLQGDEAGKSLLVGPGND